VCTSGEPSDLDTTDDIAGTVMEDIINEGGELAFAPFPFKCILLIL
jgi:hypothetical protein